MPLRVGETFAGYRILRQLGSGGMGEVYLVQHPRLPRQDALKVLRPDVSSDPAFRDRFIREADLAAGLRHPHIVGIHDRGEHNGQLWIAMDYIDGTDLGQLLEQRYPAGVPVGHVITVVTAVASALDYAHKMGLLHRDVKPANIMVADLATDDPQILLADFGIARPLDDTNGLTATNMTVGTVAYAAPEQLMGEAMDGRADEYALAATTYNLLTGSQLFPNSNPAVVISRHLNAPVPALADVRPELNSLDSVLAAALAKDPNNRFARCTDFARAFAEAIRATTRPTPSAPTIPAVMSLGPRSIRVPVGNQTPAASNSPSLRWRGPALVAAALALVAAAGVSIATLRPWGTATPPAATTPVTNAWPSTTVGSMPSAPTSVAVPPPVTTTTMWTSDEPTQPYALPGCYRGRDDVSLTERPTESPIACRHHFFEGLTWMTWGAAGAEGTGIEQRQNCTPNCAQGEIFRNRVHVLFTGSTAPPPESECPTTFRYYTQLIVAYPDLTEIPSGVSYGTDTRYNGMPAVRYNDLEMLCTEGHN